MPFLDATTEELVAPGLGVLDRQGARLRRLGPAPAPELDLYVGFFDPIIELGRERLRVGRAGDPDEALRLERRMGDLGFEQQEAARAAGLEACGRDIIADVFEAASS